jgi:hypothetical protein
MCGKAKAEDLVDDVMSISSSVEALDSIRNSSEARRQT